MCVWVCMDPVGIYTRLGNADLQHGLLSEFGSILWMQASVSHSYTCCSCQQLFGWLAGCQLSSTLQEEYYSSRADEGCDIFKGGCFMRPVLAPIWWVCTSEIQLFKISIVNTWRGVQPNFPFSFQLFSILFFLFFFFFPSIFLNRESSVSASSLGYDFCWCLEWPRGTCHEVSRWQALCFPPALTEGTVPRQGLQVLGGWCWSFLSSMIGMVQVPKDFLARIRFCPSEFPLV